MSDNTNTPSQTLDGKPVSNEQLEEARKAAEAGKRVIEVSPNVNKTLTRLKG